MAERCNAAGVRADVLPSTEDCPMKHAFSVQPSSCKRVAEWTAAALDGVALEAP